MIDRSSWPSLYNEGKSCREIAQASGCSDGLVWQHLNGIHHPMRPRKRKRSYSLDETFFDSINTEAKAYWLGFFIADGCVYGKYIQVALKEDDGDHLRRMADDMGYNGPIRIIPRDESRWGASARLFMHSERLVGALARLGVGPRKSLTATTPEIRDDLQRHFWRGIIDGDGCLTFKPTGKIVSLVGSRDICEGFSAWVGRNAGQEGTIQTKQNIFSVFFAGTHRAGIVADKLYTGANVFLHRKMEVAKRLIEYHRLRAAALIERAAEIRKWL